MQELLQRLSEDGFSIPTMQLNAKLLRFDRTGKGSGWFIGFENKTKSGESYIVAVYGDWKTGEKYEHKTKRTYTKAEQSEILKRISDSKRESERERLTLQESAKCEANSIWDAGTENSRIDYLSRKSIGSLFGCRSVLGADGRILLVPMRDSRGVLWGVQKISENGKKYFILGQRINGLFHTLGPSESPDIIYIAEGFATAASIHQATGKMTIVAFNACNLAPVAKEIKSKYETAAIVICGDDDQFTERDGELFNTGRENAEKAAKACAGKAIFPQFVSLESKPTDFNDLHILEGLESVKTQILGAPEVAKQYVLCLGFNGDKYFYTSSQNNYIKIMSPATHIKNNLLSLMSIEYWQALYPSKNEDAVDWTMAVDDLMTKCRKKGAFNLNNVRATGAWLGEKKELILNLGDALLSEGKKIGFHSVKSLYVYEPGDFNLPQPSTEVLSDEKCLWFLETISMLKWAHPDYYKYIAGWLVIAPFCGALEWRPHIWLSGPSGSGKSTIMNEVVHRLLRKTGLFFQGQTTEAGIRQSIGKKALPVVFDEFETHDEKSGQRIAQVVELFRQASYETDACITKGSSDGESISYVTRFAGFVSSVGVNLTNEADKNRFTVIELKRSAEEQSLAIEHFKDFQSRVSKIDDDFVQAFYSRTFALWDVFNHNRKLIFDEIAETHTSRMAQQYSPLLAGFQILQSKLPINEVEAKAIVLDADLEFKAKETDESDEVDCLKYLMNKKIKLNGRLNEDSSLFEMINNSLESLHQQKDWVDALKRTGIVIKEGNICVANNHPELNSMFKGTKWAGLYHRSLVRIKGSDNNDNKPIWFGGGTSKTVRIPLEVVKST